MRRKLLNRGRPRLSSGEKQDATFLVRMRPDEVDALRALAAREGYAGLHGRAGVGAYAREVLRKHLSGTVDLRIGELRPHARQSEALEGQEA